MQSKPFETGDVLRYADGPTSIMRVSAVIKTGNSVEETVYYGQHVLGGVQQALHKHCRRASAKDKEVWYDEGRRTTTSGKPLRAPWKQFLEKYGSMSKDKRKRMGDQDAT